ncbi:cytochrome P450 94C1 [Zea mays]|jgi:12-hydroxyjasmonoyl-L-amino acid 12-hydroxylase / fatty acid hydroxylase|uniref:Cytochrome P450 94C1 n=1 Tax=Zea mays TaxID=4577 RepID=A0A804UHV8_MAIZE|nr:cytochrome P450 94C1 [Zea mays]|eukprot:XP_008657035.1 cytochrome P450 94C1 [Zea mays]
MVMAAETGAALREAASALASSMQPQVAAVFFVSAACTVALAALLAVLRMRPPWWCACPVCEAYLTASWAGDFDNLCDWYAHLLRTSPAQTVHVHVLRNVLTANPATVDHMLRARFDNYPKGAPFSAILADFLGRGIFNVDGDAWLFQRKLAAAELASPALRAFAVRVVASELRGRLIPLLRSAACASGREGGGGGGGGRVLDLQDVFRRFAFDCICKISFGLDPGCLQLSMPVSSFEDAFDTASTLSARRATAPMHVVWKLKRLLNLGDERRLRDAVHLVDALAAEVIRQRRKLGGAASSGSDLLSRFMGSIDDDKYLRDIVVSFMLAGRDTVASALTAFFLLLSDHPEVAAAIRDEAARVAGDDDDGDGDDGRLTDSAFGKLKGMHYVHAALYESMRLFPPVQFDSKFAAGDDTLPDGTAVAKGTRVTYHAYAMGRMESVWGPDCGEFRPERWLRDGRFVPESPYRYPVFQAGARVCVGKELALMEMKAVIVAVVRGFDIEAVGRSSRRPRFAPGLTATFAGGLPVRVRRRARASGHKRTTRQCDETE